MSKYYTINRPMVSAEDFDGETVVIHFDTGNYYALDHFCSLVWQAVEQGFDLELLPGLLKNHLVAAESELEKLVDKVISGFLEEELIRPVSTPSPNPATELDLSNFTPAPLGTDTGTMTRFDDLQELLLMDPIHEVDEEAGWPHVKKQTDPVA